MERHRTLDLPKCTFSSCCGFPPGGDRAPWQWGAGEAGRIHLPLVARAGQSW